ncbi:MAG: polysaccharide biosynthesis C-terminal domain-containing protein [Planctomycetota bacterium]|nr:polysaccharide biosynthesis C-terminal domain-containing protein [Planctomycetota bacterium]
MDQGRRLVLNTISGQVSFGVSAVIALFLASYVLGSLGKSTYGIWALVGSSFIYHSFLTMGLNSAVNRWVPIYLVKKDYDGINRVINTVLFFYLISGALLVVVVAILAYGFPYWFDVPPELHSESRIMVVVAGAGYVSLIVFNILPAVLSGLQRYDLLAASDITADVARLLGVIALFGSGLVITDGSRLIALAAVVAGCQLLRVGLKSVFAIRNYKHLKIGLSLARWQTFRSMIGYSVNTAFISFSQAIQNNSAVILVGALLGTAAVTEYFMPMMLTGVIASIVGQGSAAIKPAASKMEAEERPDHVQKLYLKSSKYALMILFPTTAFMIAFGEDVLQIWLKKGFGASAGTILAILAVSKLFSAWHRPAVMVIIGLGKHRFLGITTFAKAIFSIILGYILGGVFEFGVVGVAAGFAIPEIVLALFPLASYCCRMVGLRVRDEVKASVLPAILAALPVLAVTIGARLLVEPKSIGQLIGLVAVLAVPTLAGWWFIGFSQEERKRFAGMIPMPGRRSL